MDGADLYGRDFLKLLDFSADEIRSLLDAATEFKLKKRNGIPHKVLDGVNIALIFEKVSTRTRCAFEVAARDLGIGTTYLDRENSQIALKESIADTARVLSSLYDGIEYRGYEQEKIETLAGYSKVPVWNGLTNEFHPTQMLADLLTIQEHFGYLKEIKLCYLGNARCNTANSLMVACAKMGMNFVAITNKKYFPDEKLVDICRETAKETKASIELTEDVEKGTESADVIYTDIWVPMDEDDAVWQDRIKDLMPYKVTSKVMDNADERAVFMHCLPSLHSTDSVLGKELKKRFGLDEIEVSDEVFESDRSIVFEQSENRLHVIKAVLYSTLMKTGE